MALLEHFWRTPECLRRSLPAEAGCHTVFAELGESDRDSLAAAAHNLTEAGFVEAYRSRNWQRPALNPAGAMG